MTSCDMGRIIIEKEDFYKKRHMRIYSGAIKKVIDAAPGDIVECYNKDGRFLCMGYYNPKSNISVRVLSFEKEKISRSFFEKRIRMANYKRLKWIKDTDAYRVVYSESDFLPGLIVDKYGDYIVIQIETLGMAKMTETIVDVLKDLFNPVCIYERSDVESRRYEGLPLVKRVLYGKEPDDKIQITENGLRFLVDIKMGQKTGFYLDQRENRHKLLEFNCERVFNLYSYTGSFGVYAAIGGAKEVINVDTSESALEIAKENFRINNIPDSKHKEIKMNCEDFLKNMERVNDYNTLVIMDPPNYVKKIKDIEDGIKKYESIHKDVFYKMEKGFLFTFCCSGLVKRSEFLKVITDAALKMRKDVNILYFSTHPYDHPISLYVYETEYLKGVFSCI